MRCTSALVAASFLASTAFAAIPQSVCNTHYGSRSVKPVRTSQRTTTKTITPTVVVTSKSTTVVTPQPTTSTTVVTNTDTSTTVISTTDTFTSTETDSTTTTIIEPTSTVTEVSTTSTTTTSTSTTTIATTAGFTPVRSTVPDSSYNGAFGGPLSRRSIKRVSYAKDFQGVEVEERAASKPNCLRPSKYPQSVDCTKTVTKRVPAVTSTTKQVITTTAPTPTSTVTSTESTTLTTTSVLTAQTTITTTTTETDTASSTPVTTTTSTSTVTSVAAASATAFGECTSDNFANARGGNTGIYLLAANNGNYGVSNFGEITNSLDCCNLCAVAVDCAVSIYTAASGGCYQLTGSSSLNFPMVQSSGYDWVVNNGAGHAVPN